MKWTEAERNKRRHNVTQEDQRTPAQRDRDRILYSSAFRRLAGITQIVRAGEADVFHTRQQHTVKVAQVGRRLAEMCIKTQPDTAAAVGLDAEVVEAACLAHDLGHPPFGHVGEHVLDELTKDDGGEGFEGNAQSFRVLTKLAVRFDECPGLDLTRASLAATLKYPWLRADVAGKNKKWGAYTSEADDFHFARGAFDHEEKTAEAELMDWADDIAYSVHDLEDFHRCRALPWHHILSKERSEELVLRASAAWFGAPVDADGRLREALRNLTTFLKGTFGPLISEPYDGSRAHRQQLRTMNSKLIGRYILAARLAEPGEGARAVVIKDEEADEVRILKQITRDYIIDNPSLAAQQKGQERIVREIHTDLMTDTKKERGVPRYLPPRLAYLWDQKAPDAGRFVADCIASLTESEAMGLHGRLRGTSSGSVLDPIVR